MSRGRALATRYQSASKRFTMWAEIVLDARRNGGEWFLALNDVPLSTARTVRQRRHPDLHNLPGGTLEAEPRNLYTDDAGMRRCDLFVRWASNEGER